VKEKLEEFNAFARKHGFRDFDEYSAVWGRVFVGRMQLAAEASRRRMLESTERSLREAEEQLRQPGLSPEMKEVYESQVQANRELLERLRRPDPSSLNEADLALVRKFLPEIEAAEKQRPKVE
jgi:hypothetical protein